MATVPQLCEEGRLVKLDCGLEDDEQEFRAIYMSGRLKDWIEQILPTLGSTWDIETSPLQQLDALLWVFGSGDILTFDWQFKPLNALGNGIWELKTADLRLFGWFAQRDVFIAVDADTKERIRELKMYRPYQDQAVRFRDQLPLDDPKFVSGEDPHAVVSNFDYPN
jgi:hypothetical protein